MAALFQVLSGASIVASNCVVITASSGLAAISSFEAASSAFLFVFSAGSLTDAAEGVSPTAAFVAMSTNANLPSHSSSCYCNMILVPVMPVTMVLTLVMAVNVTLMLVMSVNIAWMLFTAVNIVLMLAVAVNTGWAETQQAANSIMCSHTTHQHSAMYDCCVLCVRMVLMIVMIVDMLMVH